MKHDPIGVIEAIFFVLICGGIVCLILFYVIGMTVLGFRKLRKYLRDRKAGKP